MSKNIYRDLKSEMEPDVFELEAKRIAKEEEPEPLQDFESLFKDKDFSLNSLNKENEEEEPLDDFENLFVKDEDFVPFNSLKGEDKIDYRAELELLM
ncbi:MAG: hypothetical protein PHS54_03985 [Clostridia bacterium]|nr:hypothetical protein [Clostridia bacterium]